MYSFKEILELFQLTYEMNVEDLKQAKRKVLMMHPDKSRLPPDYFLFYKKAFDMVVSYFENNQKTNLHVPHINPVYQTPENDINKSTQKQVSGMIKKMSADAFQEKFNQLFEDNMSKKPDPSKNEWFSKTDGMYEIDKNVSSKNMGQIMETMKQKNAAIIQYRGVENMISSNGSQLYDDDETENQQYVTSDPFSKLKFDDLRKVHKDQTIFSVSESDIHKMPQYSSVDHLVRERGVNMTPMEKSEAERIILQREQETKQRMLAKQHSANLQSIQYSEKNKSVLSTFLRLHN